jgi:ribonuclease HII
MAATFELETVELALHGGPIAGVDEAGWGPLAGPVVAAAVVLDPGCIPQGIASSKSLDSTTRSQLNAAILATAPHVGVAVADVDHIDRRNVLNATLWAMAEAVAKLGCAPKLVLVDGNKAPRLACTTRGIPRGDARCLSIAAASIVAKVARDAIMAEIARRYPSYGFERHLGYGTREHLAAIERFGVTPEHRRSFREVQLALGLLS